MNIISIYQKLPLTPMLQLHMLRAAAVGAYIADNWQNKGQLDKRAIIEMLLFHDTGNIIKFDLDNFPQLLGDELKRVNYWKALQNQTIKEYGDDEHHATRQIAHEVGLEGKALELINRLGNSKMGEIAKNEDFEQKICIYSDTRVGPFGILTVNQRYNDIISRYAGRKHPLANTKHTEEKRKWCLVIEKQLQENTRIPLSSITDNSILSYIEDIKQYDISVTANFSTKVKTNQ